MNKEIKNTKLIDNLYNMTMERLKIISFFMRNAMEINMKDNIIH